VRIAGRYSLSAVGPIAVSGAHFAASLIFLHKLSPAEFGLFSFLLVVVPFGLSISSGLLGAPLLNAIGKSEIVAEAKRAAFREVNRFYCLAAGTVTALLMHFGNADTASSLLLGAYGATMTFRWFARYNAYNANAPWRVAASDFAYSGILLLGLAALVALGRLSLERTSAVLLLSALLGLLPFGRGFMRNQLSRPVPGFFAVYAPIWRDITRWSLMGVVASEMTANAHAYLVTLISGTHAFALLALGTLMMRPLSLVLGALPDRERPAIASALAQGDVKGALATIVDFRIVAAAMWVGNVALAVAILAWFPGLVIRDGFDPRSVAEVVAIWALIGAVRALRAPEAAFLTAAGEFHPLARAGLWGSALSLGGTALLLVLFGPVVSLGGIAAGEVAMTLRVMALMASWRRIHG
jgi:O-antigen/teichoic acid export membrane protein